jgi:hypothetical protein
VAVGLLLLLLIAIGAAWFFEGRYETPPAQAAKQLLPYKVDDLQKVVLTAPGGTATFTRDSSGKLTLEGPAPAPTATPAPDATPSPVVLTPSTQLSGMLGQLATLPTDQVIAKEPSHSPEFGLDAPQLIIEMTPKQGPPGTIAIGGLNPDKSSYYVRRETTQKDTVLASRYTLDDLIKVADGLMGIAPTPTPGPTPGTS